jgi:hypothetical protein
MNVQIVMDRSGDTRHEFDAKMPLPWHARKNAFKTSRAKAFVPWPSAKAVSRASSCAGLIPPSSGPRSFRNYTVDDGAFRQ